MEQREGLARKLDLIALIEPQQKSTMKDSYEQRIGKLGTWQKCETFAKNAEERGRPDLAILAKRRAVELRVSLHKAQNLAEKESLRAVYAYEETLARKHGKRIRASRTWQMIKQHGIIHAVERAVNRTGETQGYKALAEMGMLDYAFENVVLRHPELFRAETVKRAKTRVKNWDAEKDKST